jgi:acetamidase/formamidase
MIRFRGFDRALAARLALAALVMMAFPAGAQQTVSTGRDVTGDWILWRSDLGTDFPLRVRVERQGDSVVATGSNGLRLAGLPRDRLTIAGKSADGRAAVQLDARWQGDSLIGTATVGDQTTPARLVRERARPASAPRRQLFRPTVFHRVFTSGVTPALRLWPGDTVRTETISAGGRDSTGARRSLGGNPLTGPFWIEGALPGDLLAVRLLRIRTTSTQAGSGAGLAWNAVTPDYLADYKEAEDSGSTWLLDPGALLARLKTPSEALRGFSVPLRPMLGCVGVAPGFIGRAETLSSGLPGRHGGNMDYNRVVAGATLYLPVTQPGAFLFLGDGHAAQGDGELTGSGLETPMEVEFSVDLIQGKRIGFPRIEDAAWLMSVGVGGSLDQAFQIATTGMARWLEQDFNLTRSEAAIIMGTALQYDIAEVVDGDLTIVARLAKAVMSGVQKPR